MVIVGLILKVRGIFPFGEILEVLNLGQEFLVFFALWLRLGQIKGVEFTLNFYTEQTCGGHHANFVSDCKQIGSDGLIGCPRTWAPTTAIVGIQPGLFPSAHVFKFIFDIS
jgi:hypothetical protein